MVYPSNSDTKCDNEDVIIWISKTLSYTPNSCAVVSRYPLLKAASMPVVDYADITYSVHAKGALHGLHLN